eukprot:2598194-Pyramimonas_sp.AAC.2
MSVHAHANCCYNTSSATTRYIPRSARIYCPKNGAYDRSGPSLEVPSFTNQLAGPPLDPLWTPSGPPLGVHNVGTTRVLELCAPSVLYNTP